MGTNIIQRSKYEQLSDRQLFASAIGLYSEGQSSKPDYGFLENRRPEQSSLFILRGDEYLLPSRKPPIKPSAIRRNLINDTSGIFRCRLSDDNGEVDYFISCVYVDRDRHDRVLAIGLIYEIGADCRPENEVCFYEAVNRFKRFFHDCRRSSAFDRFQRYHSDFKVIIDIDREEIVFGQSCGNFDHQELTDPAAFGWLADVVKSHADGAAHDVGSYRALDKRMKLVNIHRCRLGGTNYILVSVNMADKKSTSTELQQLISGFAHKIGSKLAALQAAVSQLQLQKGNVITDDDIDLFHIIRKASESISEHINSLHRYARIGPRGNEKIDVNADLTDLVKHRKADAESNLGFNLELDEQVGEITGNREQLNNMFSELLDNAIRASGRGEKISIKTSRQDNRLSISIINKTEKPVPANDHEISEDIFKPFFTYENDKPGMGLTLARKIITAHDGAIEVRRRSERELETTVNLPLTVGKEDD